MTMTLAIIVNAVLALGIVAALAAMVRLAHRLSERERPETLHPSQPISSRVVREWDGRIRVDEDEDERELARAA